MVGLATDPQCGQPLESTADAIQRQSMPLYLEFTLSFLLARAAVAEPVAARRLNAFEDLLTTLASRWRPRIPLSPAREIRMCQETREALLAWLEAEEPTEGNTLCRLAIYAVAVTDERVPEGWVRLHLRNAA